MPKKRSPFTMEGYNDRAKPCPKKKCKGMVQPTWNANVGKCDACGERFGWSDFSREED